MKPRLLMWRFFTLIMVTDCMTEFCAHHPPKLKNATFKALTYKTGTLLICDCKTGFRRLDWGFMNCTGNPGHSSWKNQCQCGRMSSGKRGKPVIPTPEGQKETNTTDVQSSTQPTDHANLPGLCREPPPWEHEAPQRMYHFVVGQTLHYKCDPGFRALRRGPAKSICKTVCGKAQWTQPLLMCIQERMGSPFPGDKESQANTDTPSGSDTSCPFMTTDTTTDSQKHTQMATTVETVLFTTGYQMAVAGCVLLLISILVLSGLTWQQKWRSRCCCPRDQTFRKHCITQQR